MTRTATPIPTYTELTKDIHALVLAHVDDARFDYFVDAYAAILKARRVTRIDLWELMNAATDYSRVDPFDALTDLNARIAWGSIARTYNAMDYAAAFSSTDAPLVIDANDDADYYNFSVLAHDTDPMRDAKRDRQRPSVPSYREYIAR